MIRHFHKCFFTTLHTPATSTFGWVLIMPWLVCAVLSPNFSYAQNTPRDSLIDPATRLWYRQPAAQWEEALPVGNGRLGAMVYGRTSEEIISLNEETYWSGGPYSTVVSGGAKVLPEIQQALFAGDPLKAHKLFGRYLMGYPVEQQKYQALANLYLFFFG